MTAFKTAVLVACAALVGCSAPSTAGGGGGTGANPTFSEFCTGFIDSLGGRVATCNGGPKELWVKTLGGSVRCSDVGNAIDAGRSTYDGTHATACLTSIAAISCSTVLSSSSSPDCTKTLVGKVAVGGTCYASGDCGDAVFCSVPAGMCSGTCKSKAAAAGTCGPTDECVDGYGCVNQVCTIDPPAGSAMVGASCTGGVQCKPGLTCDRVTNNCAQPIKEGQACPFGHGTCDFFSSCSNTTNTCVRAASVGGACGTKSALDGGSDYESGGCIDSYCKIATGTASGTCTAPAADNAVCQFGYECLSGTCTASKCAPRCVIP